MIHQQNWDIPYTHPSDSIGKSPALPEHQHLHLPHSTREARAPPNPDPRGPCNHKSKASY